MRKLTEALAEARACTVCAAHLPLGPRPILRGKAGARLLLVGQAPGTRVHASGIPWDDRSGDRLRDWLGLERDVFYNESQLAILPMGLCYPGANPKGGDLPPRPECAPLWHPRIRPLLPRVELLLLIGSYAQAYYLKDRRKRSLNETVAAWREYMLDYVPLPHPSWLKANPWFERELVPELRKRTAEMIA